MTQTIYVKEKLDTNEQTAIEALRVSLEKKGIAHKLDLDYLAENKHTKHLLFWTDKQLTAYGVLTSYDPEELEVTIMLEKSQPVFEQIIDSLYSYIEDKPMNQFVVILDHKHQIMQDYLAAADCTYDFSEFYMTLSFEKFNQVDVTRVPLVSGETADAKELGRFLNDGEDFELAREDLERFLLYKKDDTILSSLRIDESDNVFGIYGFVVKEQLRGQGIGRKVLTTALQDIMNNEPKKVYLEVETENANAVHLYQALGFEEQIQFDYYTFSKSK
ncbi:GNAT family N-acetyltransferase [Enterococcus sp. LJL51]|uniref:GNAT family N-acetyltransferase n=1 Tax=Enterococcus sp. LJL51 TaxID=3416656 RepID=UPI003CF0E727